MKLYSQNPFFIFTIYRNYPLALKAFKTINIIFIITMITIINKSSPHLSEYKHAARPELSLVVFNQPSVDGPLHLPAGVTQGHAGIPAVEGNGLDHDTEVVDLVLHQLLQTGLQTTHTWYRQNTFSTLYSICVFFWFTRQSIGQTTCTKSTKYMWPCVMNSPPKKGGFVTLFKILKR